MISAAIFRLMRTREFKIQVGIVCALPVVLILSGYNMLNLMNAYVLKLLSQFFGHTLVIEFLTVLIASHIWGCEYEFGGIRNKIICGHSKRNIYITNLLTILICTMGLTLIYVSINMVLGLPLLGTLKMSLGDFLIYLILDLAFVSSISAFFCFISSIFTKEDLSLRISLIVLIVALICGLVMYKKFSIEEFQGIYIDPVLGAVPGRNDLYVGGSARIALELLQCVFPCTQSILLVNEGVEHYILPLLGSIIIFMLSTMGGILLFNRRDIK